MSTVYVDFLNPEGRISHLILGSERFKRAMEEGWKQLTKGELPQVRRDIMAGVGGVKPYSILPVRRIIVPVDEAEDLYIAGRDAVHGDVGMSIVPLTVEAIKYGAPWIVQQIAVQGLKALTIAELLEMVTGREFYSLDDVLRFVTNILSADLPDAFGLDVGVGGSGDPKEFRKGAVREGWYIKQITDYDYGKETSKKVWYKPYEDASRGKTGAVMNFRERCAYFQGKRVQAYDSRQAKYRAYKRGYGHGSGDQFMAQAVMGHTRPCAPQIFYTKGRFRQAGYGRR